VAIIKYFDGKKTIIVEVSEEVAKGFKESQREEWRTDKRAQRHETASTHEHQDLSTEDILSTLISAEENTSRSMKYTAFFSSLTAEQRKVLRLLISHKGINEIAAELVKHHSSISETKKAIQKKFEKIFK
jgi:DNA-binding NarL/FixJ family response regulator